MHELVTGVQSWLSKVEGDLKETTKEWNKWRLSVASAIIVGLLALIGNGVALYISLSAKQPSESAIAEAVVKALYKGGVHN